MTERLSTTSIYNIPDFGRFSVFSYSKFNLSLSESDIHIFVKEYKDRIKKQLLREEENDRTPFPSFADKRPSVANVGWMDDNQKRFFNYTPNDTLVKQHYLSEMGFINCMVYSPGGQYIVVGHSTGLIQVC